MIQTTNVKLQAQGNEISKIERKWEINSANQTLE